MSRLDLKLPADSFLEAAFLRWVLGACAHDSVVSRVRPQYEVEFEDRGYRIDYVLEGAGRQIAVELDGYAFHSDRGAFTYDRLRQNDLAAAGFTIIRFSYDAVRGRTTRCAEQLAAVMSSDPELAKHLKPALLVEVPIMPADATYSLARPSTDAPDALPDDATYFDRARLGLDARVLRSCQQEALDALTNYYGHGRNAACVMSVGAGKTALGVAAALRFTRRRALIVTPGRVIRGTFDDALDGSRPRSVLYNLPAGPLLPGKSAPKTLTLDADLAPVAATTAASLHEADVIVTNFHSLGTGADPRDLLAKLSPDDIDFIVVDEAHIAAADSYQRLFRHFPGARTLLMSACFQRLDGKPIDADVVYRYRLVDSINDGTAKNLRIHRFAPHAASTEYELRRPDGTVERIVGREALLEVLRDDRRLATITAASDASIRQVMSVTTACLATARKTFHPIKPRVLFAALGQAHAVQIAAVAKDFNIACDVLHHSMTNAEIKQVRQRYESDAGDLDGVVQLKMLGQGYDFPPICIVVPLRPYGSFGEFYQFIGRGIRIIADPRLAGRVPPEQQLLDVVIHNELGLDDHLATVLLENEMDPTEVTQEHADDSHGDGGGADSADSDDEGADPITGALTAHVLVETGTVGEHVLYDEDRLAAGKRERELAAFAFRYQEYAATQPNPVSFEQYCEVLRRAK